MTHVAEEGNRRKGDMTNAEVGQSILDVETWFKKHAKGWFEDAKAASEGDLQALEKTVDASIPEELRTLMSIQNGQLWFSEKQALACKEMVVEALELEATRIPGWRSGLIPFAKDVDRNFLVLNTNEHGCPVTEWDADGEGATVARTFSLFLEGFRNELLSGRCEFVEGLGVVEKMASSPPRGRK